MNKPKMKNKKATKKDSSPNLKQKKISEFYFKKSEKRPSDPDDDPVEIVRAPKKFAESPKKKNQENTPPKIVVKPAPVKKCSKEILKNVENLNGGEAGEKTEKTEDVIVDDFDDVDFEADFFKSPKKLDSDLDLSRGKICVAVDVRMGLKNEQILTVKSEDGEGTTSVKLRDVWAYVPVKIDDVLTVNAVKISDEWVVDSKNGYVSLYPGQSITSTALVGAMFCMRRAVLSNFFKGFDPGNKIMVVGRLVHELFQNGLKKVSCTDEDVEELLKGTDVLTELYSAGLTLEEIDLELKSFVPKISTFLDRHVNGKDPPESGFRNGIREIVDIEEDVLSDKLGMKGRIDVTVKIDDGRTMPLELKTGRASFSNEHKFQVVLYNMILSELGRDAASGLLLYLRDGKMEEIKATHLERRDLILLRNQLVGWLRNFKNFKLPEPVRFEKACAKCPYLTVCHAFLQNDDYKDLSPNHPMRGMSVREIKKSHLDYFVKWIKFCFLEGEEDDPDEKSSVLNDLELEDGVAELRNGFKHVFKKKKDDDPIPPGSFVSINDDKKKRICFGKVVNSTSDTISVLSDKKLKPAGKYGLTGYNSNILNKYLTNLGVLLDASHENLRDIVIDKKKPNIPEKIAKEILRNDEIVRILKPLNKEQQSAVCTVLSTEDYCLIKGPPGTGKTQTLVALIEILYKLKKSVLITGHTHSSVDNILSRLPGGVEFVRFGSLKSVDRKLHDRCFDKLIENCKTVADVKKLYEAQVVASTCLGVDPDLVDKRKFDVCLIDESSQVLQPETLKPLFCSKKFVLIGDSDQLPPIVRNREAKKSGMDESLFLRLENETSTVSLRRQYRMNETINRLANELTYRGSLECADEKIARATISSDALRGPEWIRDVLSSDLNRSVVFLDTSEYFKKNEKSGSASCSSTLEKNIVLKLTKALVESGMPQESVGVISPFRAQVELIQSEFFKYDLKNVDVSTVDRYQGRDKEIVLYSFAKENRTDKATDEFEILNDKRRLTVAVTRAKYKLIVVGDAETVKAYEPVRKLIGSLKDRDIVKLNEKVEDFTWDQIDF